MTVARCWSVQSTEARSQDKFAEPSERIQPIISNDIKKQRNQIYLKNKDKNFLMREVHFSSDVIY